ncbi:MAG: hypothetical protein ACK4HV_00060 [Parachlamydiaceae bacterium]
MFFRLLILSLCIFLAGCSKRTESAPEWIWEKKIDTEELTRTTVRYTTLMERKHKLHLEDSRVYYTDCTEKIRLVLSSQNLYEICEARELITEFVEGYLNALNMNPSIRADLCSQPFTYEDLDIYINFESYFGEYVDPFYVGWMELDDGLVNYYMFTLKQWYYDRWNCRTEPYQKALEIANAQREANLIYPPNKSTGEKNINDSSTIMLDQGRLRSAQEMGPMSVPAQNPRPPFGRDRAPQ